ncbi:MarR family winged helix-turn-helix transcriptional regulator [Actinoalloteichus hymeniacidonis]|nr:MarR family transcriptional regulator [Actinoalloteichus hymeniacidonis]MBB5910953.1 DNA-binding MarR family transcriptional regulator [Actinoalloteichus hymeniacidonis]
MTIAVQASVVQGLVASGLSEPDYEVLSTLVEAPEMTSTLHAQAEKMGWSRSRLSRHAGRMEARELIRRDPDPADGRGCLLVLTPLGRDTLRGATAMHLESVRRSFADRLDERDLSDIARIAGKLAQPQGPS